MKLNRSGGRDPERRFPATTSVCKFLSSLSSVGTEPDRSLKLRSSSTKADISPSDGGMEEDKALCDKFRRWSFESAPILAGIKPSTEFEERSRNDRF